MNKMSIKIFLLFVATVSAVIFLVFCFVLPGKYSSPSSLDVKGIDFERAMAVKKIANALLAYTDDYQAYPQSLDMLAPKYIQLDDLFSHKLLKGKAKKMPYLYWPPSSWHSRDGIGNENKVIISETPFVFKESKQYRNAVNIVFDGFGVRLVPLNDPIRPALDELMQSTHDVQKLP